MQYHTIRLPVERVEQLRRFGDANGAATFGAIVGDLLGIAAEAGHADPFIPGVTVERVGTDIRIAFDGIDERVFSSFEAGVLMGSLTNYLATGNGHICPEARFALNAKGGPSVEIYLNLDLDGPRKRLTRDLVTDLIGLIRRAA